MKKKITLTLLIVWGLVGLTKSGAQVALSDNRNASREYNLLLKNVIEKEPETAPNFILLDLEGNNVSLEDYKGKVVVLDFWATWCAPCIKSFPAMQLAVDRYQEDPDVQFLFINTWEQKDDPTLMVRQFMEKRGFDFLVLMDKKDVDSKVNPVVESYGVIGIPAKFIIDGDGNIRYKLTGFTGGDNEEQVKELSLLIESSRI